MTKTPEGDKDPRGCQRSKKVTKTPGVDKTPRGWKRAQRVTKAPEGDIGVRGFGENIGFCIGKQIMTIVMVWCTDCFCVLMFVYTDVGVY